MISFRDQPELSLDGCLCRPSESPRALYVGVSFFIVNPDSQIRFVRQNATQSGSLDAQVRLLYLGEIMQSPVDQSEKPS